ncbi:MAG: hypothetical protein HY293_18300 [Planctomycetes bacterium]|nr:hypothetical protein [Planctomycetota bacterium]
MKLAVALLLLADGLSVEEFQKLHQDLRPSKDDLWRSIPWKVSLAEAQALAIKEQKPLFMWSMDGHPLGCT